MTRSDLGGAALLALAGILPLLVFAFILLALFEHQQGEAADQRLQRTAENFATAVEREIRAELGIIEGLAASTTLDGGNFDDFRREARRLQEGHPHWFTVVLSDGRRQVFNLRFAPGDPLPPIRDPATVSAIFATARPVVGPLEHGGVGLGVPVIRNGAVRYTIAAVISPGSFLDGLQQYQLPEGWIGTVADTNGRIIGRSREADSRAGQPLASEFQVPVDLEPNRVLETTASDGVPVYGLLVPVGAFGWHVLLTAPMEAVDQPYRSMHAAVRGGAALAVVLTVLLSAALLNGWATRRRANALLDANERLRASEARLRLEHEFMHTLIRQAPVGISITEASSGRSIVLNQKATEFLGHTQKGPDIRRYATYGALHADGRPYAVDDYPTVRALRRGEVVEREEMLYRRGDGDVTRLEVSSAPVRDDDGRVMAAVTVFSDVERQRRTEEALRAGERRLRDSEERLRLAAQVGGFGTFDWDLTRDEHVWSAETYDIYGLPRDVKVTYDRVFRTIHPEDSARARDTVAAGLDPAGPGEWAGEYRIVRPDGEVRWLSARSRAIFADADGERRAIRVIGAVQDVTAQRMASETLRAERDRARLYFETAEVMLVVIGADRRVQMINRKGAEILGLPAEDVVGRDWFATFLPERLRPAVGDVFDALVRGRADAPDTYENSVLRADGTERHVVWRNAVIRDDAGRLTAVLSSGDDVTERKRAEEALRRNETRLGELRTELMHASRLTEMGQMAAALAHEVNQPLAAVTNYISGCRLLLKADRVDASTRREIMDVMNLAREQAIRAGRIIRRLREFVAKGETERRVEDVGKVVEEASALALVGAQHRGVAARCVVGTSARVLVDKVQIQQVVVNLVRNAIEAMDASERKEIEISVAETGEGGLAEVRVSDTGPGLPAEIAEHLFEPFASTKSWGMGIGLSVCRSIVDAHGGRIWAEANPAGGTTFRFTLPIIQEDGHVD